MIPVKILYQEESGLYHLFCGIKKMYGIDDSCRVVCTLEYEKNQLYSCFYEEPKTEEDTQLHLQS